MNHKPLPSNPSSGKDSKLVSRLKGKSECWSLEQKEAILKAVFRWEDGLKGNTQPAHNEKLLERLEAITKGEEQ